MNDAAITRQPARTRLQRAITSSLINPAEASLVTGSALLTVLSFPNFDLWFFAWISLAPLLFVVARAANLRKAFISGWLWGTIFFYGTCWWLTFPMIHYAGISRWLAYPLLLIPIVFVSVFTALASAVLSLTINRFGFTAIFTAPVIWVAFDWLRYVITGLGSNSLGYSQAFHPVLIQPAAWGGVSAVTFLLVLSNTIIVFPMIRRTVFANWMSVATSILLAGFISVASSLPTGHRASSSEPPATFVIAVQPNVPMVSDTVDMEPLLNRHLELSKQGLLSFLQPFHLGSFAFIRKSVP